MTEPSVDQSVFEGAIAGLFALGTATASALGISIRSAQKQNTEIARQWEENLEKQAEHEQKQRDDLWKALDEERKERAALERRIWDKMGNLATTDALSEMENRLINSIKLILGKGN